MPLLLLLLCRPMTSTPSLTISGSTFYLPAPELEYLRQQAEDSNTFVLLLKGKGLGQEIAIAISERGATGCSFEGFTC
jgi:hypothetical protein